MALLGALGKIGKFALKGASFLPIPGAGALGKVGDALGVVGDVASAGAGAAKAGRMDEAALQTRMNEGNNRAQLEAAGFNADRERQLMRQALAAKMIGGMQPPSDPRAARFVRPPDPAMLEMLNRYGANADQAVSRGSFRVTPTMSNIPKSGLLEKTMGGVGVAGGILNALGRLRTPPIYGPGN